jgi:hypothetical protein
VYLGATPTALRKPNDRDFLELPPARPPYCFRSHVSSRIDRPTAINSTSLMEPMTWMAALTPGVCQPH